MTSETWRATSLGDVADIVHGWPFKSEYFSDSDAHNNAPIVVAIGNFRYTGGFRFESTKIKRYIDSYPSQYKLNSGDILLAMTCQTAGGEILGIPGRVPADGEQYLHNQRLGKVVPREESALPDFLYWLFLWNKFNAHLFATASGTKILHTSPSKIASFQFMLPPLEEQRRIAAVLGALDDKIELNRKMNRTLEEMAQALFKSWFVDFDGHEDLVDSDLGPIPRGWSAGQLLDIADCNPESWSGRTHPDDVSYVDLSNTKWGVIESTSIYSWEDAPSRARQVLRPGDTIVGTVRPGNGSFALIAEDGLTGSTGFAVLRPKQQHYSSAVYLCATAPANIARLGHLADGGAYPAVRPQVVAETMMAIPPDTVSERFASIVDPLFERRALNHKESRTLAALRDLLLPKLISGELRVPESLP